MGSVYTHRIIYYIYYVSSSSSNWTQNFPVPLGFHILSSWVFIRLWKSIFFLSHPLLSSVFSWVFFFVSQSYRPSTLTSSESSFHGLWSVYVFVFVFNFVRSSSHLTTLIICFTLTPDLREVSFFHVVYYYILHKMSLLYQYLYIHGLLYRWFMFPVFHNLHLPFNSVLC